MRIKYKLAITGLAVLVLHNGMRELCSMLSGLVLRQARLYRSCKPETRAKHASSAPVAVRS